MNHIHITTFDPRLFNSKKHWTCINPWLPPSSSRFLNYCHLQARTWELKCLFIYYFHKFELHTHLSHNICYNSLNFTHHIAYVESHDLNLFVSCQGPYISKIGLRLWPSGRSQLSPPLYEWSQFFSYIIVNYSHNSQLTHDGECNKLPHHNHLLEAIFNEVQGFTPKKFSLDYGYK